jgi:hypothetical protein
MRNSFTTEFINRLILRATLRAGQIGSFVNRNRKPLQIGAGAVALTAGFSGWMIERPPADIWGVWDSLLRTFQLITLQFPHDLGSTRNLLLQFARLAVPTVALLASFQILIASFTRPARLALLPYTTGHIAICGSGRMTQDALALLASREQQVIVVGKNVGNIASLEGMGLTVLDAAPEEPQTLTSLHLPGAAAFFVLGDDDLVNLNIAMNAISLAQQRLDPSSRLLLAVRIAQDELAYEFDFALDSLSRRYGIRYRRINTTREAIRLELVGPKGEYETKRFVSKALIVGLLPEWRQIAMQLIILMQSHPTEQPMLTFVVDTGESSALESWLKDRPELKLVVNIQILQCENGALVPSESSCSQWQREVGLPQLAVILRSDSIALSTALALKRSPWLIDVLTTSIFVHQSKEDRILSGLRQLDTGQYGIANIIAIGGLLRAESVERLLYYKGDELAIALHTHYLARTSTLPATSEEALREWDDLPENLRDSNRAVIDHAPILFGAIGCAMRRGRSSTEIYNPSDAEIEILAQVEHRRWMADRIDRGWRFGEHRDNKRRLHPDLVAYDELSKVGKEKDRAAVRTLIAVLGQNGVSLTNIVADEVIT